MITFPCFSCGHTPIILQTLAALAVSSTVMIFSGCEKSVQVGDDPAPSESAIVEAESVRVSGEAKLASTPEGTVQLTVEKPQGQCTVTFEFKENPLDLSGFQFLVAKIHNETDAELDIRLTALSALDNSITNRAVSRFLVYPEETTSLRVFMTRAALPRDHPLVKKLGNMYGFPGGHHRHWEVIQPGNIVRVNVRVLWSGAEPGQTITLSHPFGSSEFRNDPALLETLDFPLVDEFGQMRSREWETKVRAAQELSADGEADLARVAEASFGEGLNRFGGWSSGPRREATGFFRVEKVNGQWWFVDPEGCLFWSVGANSVGRGSATAVSGREALFPAGVTGDHSPYEENLKRKFGESGWEERHADVILARMKDWGMNTVGAWSMAELYDRQEMPYTLIVHTDKQGIGSIRKMPDPYSDAFKNSLEGNLQKLAEVHAESPQLIGVFIHNELEWKGGIQMSEEILGEGPRKPARLAAIQYLQEKHGTIAALNQAWGTEFPDFASVRPKVSNAEAYREDLTEIMERFADQYFAVCRAAMRRFFPHHLYLGARFNNFHPIVTRAASRHCDVVSANIYHYGVTDFSMQTDEDRPLLIGEFHFGIGDFGHWGKGLRSAADARNQADLLRAYMQDALRRPDVVGAHWFAWADQPVTGRGDGENFGIGLVSIVDRPHEKLIESLKQSAASVPEIRLPQ
jgi:hypothetical protein